MAKLLDYKKRVRSRRIGENIFAAVTRLHLAVQRERPRRRYRDDTFRFELKRRLMQEVVEARPPQPDEEQRILRLLAFLDWLVALPTELESLFFDETESARGADVMPYVTSWERMGIEKGLEQGLERGREQGLQLGELREKHTVLKRLFDRKFGLSPEDVELIDGTDDPDRLDAALDAIIGAGERGEVLGALRTERE